MRTNNLEENIADVVKETNSNEESEICIVIKYIDTIQYEDYEENTSLVELNHPILNNYEINTVDIDEIVTDDAPSKKRKTKTKKNNKVSREESKLKIMADYMGYSRKGKNVSQDQLRNKRKMKETCNSKV